MAGTDSTKRSSPSLAAATGPVIILVDSQMAENIGTCARAMLNCGLKELRLVRPREGWPHDKAVAAASGADVVLEKAKVFSTTEEAIADLQHVYAATARGRGMNKVVLSPRRAARQIRKKEASGARCGILLGPERSGLVNDDIALADATITAALNPAFRSLNLAQAVLLMAYEWFLAGPAEDEPRPVRRGARPATKAELMHLFAHLEGELDAAGFLRVREKRPIMVRNLRNIFQRAELMDFEVKTLRGIITSLVNFAQPRKTPKKAKKPHKTAKKQASPTAAKGPKKGPKRAKKAAKTP